MVENILKKDPVAMINTEEFIGAENVKEINNFKEEQ